MYSGELKCFMLSECLAAGRGGKWRHLCDDPGSRQGQDQEELYGMNTGWKDMPI